MCDLGLTHIRDKCHIINVHIVLSLVSQQEQLYLFC